MQNITDEELIEELRKRFAKNENALRDLMVLTEKLTLLNEKLRQSESLKTNFLSNIRNEMNNPLTVILGMSQQLTGPEADLRLVPRIADAICREAFDLDFQLKNIFFAAEIEAGESVPSISRTKVDALARGVMGSFRQRAEEKKIQLIYQADDANVGFHFATDPEKLSCILANLLANAIEYSPEGKTVRILAGKAGERLQLSVADEGPGIPEKDRERIFDRFTQLETGTKRHHRGHGLGLSVTKALTEMLGGTLTLLCPLGSGCIFTLMLPEAAAGQSRDLSESANEYIFEGAEKF